MYILVPVPSRLHGLSGYVLVPTLTPHGGTIQYGVAYKLVRNFRLQFLEALR